MATEERTDDGRARQGGPATTHRFLMTMRRDLPPDLCAGSFTTSEALQLGVTASRLRAADLEHPFRGVHSTVAARDMIERARALLPVLPDRAVFSHATAAMVFGVALPAALEHGPVHVTVRKPGRGSTRRGVIWHHCDAELSVVVRGGLRVLAPPVVFCQLAACTTLGSLVAVGDHLVTGREPVSGAAACSTIAELRSAVDAWGSRRGARMLTRAMELVRWGPLSRPESMLRVGLVLAGLPEPLINHRVWHPLERRHFMVDLAFPELRIALEYEGDYHRTDRVTFESDILRREQLAEIGWTVIRVTAHDLAGGWDAFLGRFRAHIRRASASH